MSKPTGRVPPPEHRFRPGGPGGPGRPKRTEDIRHIVYWFGRYFTDPRNRKRFFKALARAEKYDLQLYFAVCFKMMDRWLGRVPMAATAGGEGDPYALPDALWPIMREIHREMTRMLEHPARAKKVPASEDIVDVEPLPPKVAALAKRIQAVDGDGDPPDGDRQDGNR